MAGPVAVETGDTYSEKQGTERLAPGFFDHIIRKYEGTRLGRQELEAELLEDTPGALWNRERLEEARWPTRRAVPQLRRIVVAIDPAATSGEESDETGTSSQAKTTKGMASCSTINPAAAHRPSGPAR